MIPEKFHYYLLALAKAHTRGQRKKLILAADPKIINIISEIALNILRGNIQLTSQQLQSLRPYSKSINRLVDRRLTQASKRKLLVNQTGGFLPLIVPLISSLAGGLLGSVFNK